MAKKKIKGMDKDIDIDWGGVLLQIEQKVAQAKLTEVRRFEAEKLQIKIDAINGLRYILKNYIQKDSDFWYELIDYEKKLKGGGVGE